MINDLCISCKHYELGRQCKAFEEIPDVIWDGNNDHSKPLPGQKNDIIFNPIDKSQ